MTRTTLAAALALAMLPALPAMAGPSCSGDMQETTSACGEGQVFDDTTKACVTKPTS
jgi:hypothetical protein